MATVNKVNRNKYVLITGATSGIGYEIARLFAKDSYNLILVARSSQRLQQVTDKLKNEFSVEITPIEKDLFLPLSAMEIQEEIEQMGISIDALVNNAGQGE